ncbi:MAG: lipopolysaccharide heptosyltransferase II [Burkholderia sp.]
MRRVLVIAPNWIGDALMAQPLFALLKKLHPQIVIDAVAPSWVAPVLERMPEIGEVQEVDATDLAHGKLQMLHRWKFASDLREVGYDAAYVLPNSLKSALIPWLAGIPLRIGYTGESRYALLNVRHMNPPKTHDSRPPMVPFYAALAYAPGTKRDEALQSLPMPRLEADLNDTVRVSTRFDLDMHKPLIVFCPGAEYGPAKRWPPEHFAALACIIGRSFPYMQMIALGSPKDASTAQTMADQAPGVRNLCGQTSLSEACALIARANAVVTNDSGLMHVAAALNRPLVALYGSTDPRHTPPLSNLAKVQFLLLECSPCFQRACPLGHLNCLRELNPEQVFDDLRGMLCSASTESEV